MKQDITNRDALLTLLRKELVGPDPQGEGIDCTTKIVFSEPQQSYMPYRDKTTGEEILQRDRPTKRYGIGVLYPREVVDQNDAGLSSEVVDGSDDITEGEQTIPAAEGEPLTAQAQKDLETIERRTTGSKADIDAEDLDLTSANTYRPSSMAISFVVDLPHNAELCVHITGGRYQPLDVEVAGKMRTWWLRSPVTMLVRYAAQSLLSNDRRLLAPDEVTSTNSKDLDLQVEVFTRLAPDQHGQLLTVCLVNRKMAPSAIDQFCLYQAHFTATVLIDGQPRPCILPYPTTPMEKMDAEEQSLALLYRHAETFAVGHGCAADWQGVTPARTATSISAESLPTFETPSVTPEIRREDGSVIEVSMAALAGLIAGTDGLAAIEEVITRYDDWTKTKNAEIAGLPGMYQPAASAQLGLCADALQRMRRGLAYLRATPEALAAFRLANHAILLQQIQSRRDSRTITYDPAARRIVHSQPFQAPDPLRPPLGRGTWRPFQIAFFVMALESTAERDSPYRDLVELIWFPTGGGKTEAYLGLSAFSIFLRRLRNPKDAGVDVVMRYTLRLLTAQQFQRSAGLICAMDYLRRQDRQTLGNDAFSIGIWVGGDTTPNTRTEAITALNALRKNPVKADNPFVLTKCPWCGGQLGPLDLPQSVPPAVPRVVGYERQGVAFVFRCSDPSCEFADQLPVFVVDEDIYGTRPSLIIGTVDKFAMLAWRPEAKALFGLGSSGERVASPPSLIVQDELHLISGPLGTMVGLFEVVVEELCTDRRAGTVKPKIISSTATIRRYAEQVKALYAREAVALFPPPGLEAANSYFARYATRADGTLEPGRKYVGVHAPGLGSVQTAQVRTFAALLQAPVPLLSQERDPWWTLVAFFNSLRELGTTLSLFQSDIPDYLKAVKNRTGIDFSQIRRLRHIKELTGRLTSDQIPEAIAALEAACGGPATPVDVCLASNIIEVGIDIDRLSLMTVVGQPKTTSQYIQVTGRIGRKWWDRPGLVVTIYGASKPRDRSHFEKFRSYHERLYAQVEPTSVTPFSPPALERALHAVMAAYIRQTGNEQQAISPYPLPASKLAELETILRGRVMIVDPEEEQEFSEQFTARLDEWRRWERVAWSSFAQNNDLPLLRVAGAYCSAELARLSWPTQQSMRNVDAECQVEITTLYVDGETVNA
jgi:hypothetical protein